ncbi:MAG TPA: hypothetical protein VN366_06095 [Feifaniaceae bacterium]|nr:hypothetical protein [Feifaniaceae bacterium]
MDNKRKPKAETGIIARVAAVLKANKKLELAVYIGLALLIVLLYVSTLFPKNEKPASAEPAQDAQYASQTELEVEKRLETVLSSIRGAGRVEVMITYESGPEIVTAMNTDTNTNRSESVDREKESTVEQKTESQKPATVSGSNGTEPIVITEKQPAVRGVIVVAEGADNVAVRMDLQRAVQTVLNVPASSIEVFALEGGGISGGQSEKE